MRSSMLSVERGGADCGGGGGGGEGGSVCMCVGACMHACVYMHTDGNVNVLRTRNLQYCGQGAASGHLSQAHTSGAAKG